MSVHYLTAASFFLYLTALVLYLIGLIGTQYYTWDVTPASIGNTNATGPISLSLGLNRYCYHTKTLYPIDLCSDLDRYCTTVAGIVPPELDIYSSSCHRFNTIRVFLIIAIIFNFFALAGSFIGVFRPLSSCWHRSVFRNGIHSSLIFGLISFALGAQLVPGNASFGWSFATSTAAWIIVLLSSIIFKLFGNVKLHE
jgi:hypothetical protein